MVFYRVLQSAPIFIFVLIIRAFLSLSFVWFARLMFIWAAPDRSLAFPLPVESSPRSLAVFVIFNANHLAERPKKVFFGIAIEIKLMIYDLHELSLVA